MAGERRATNDIFCAIIEALLAQGTWAQARLARYLDLPTRTLRAHMRNLERLGVKCEEDGRDIYYSVPRNWLIGAGINLSNDQVVRVLRQVLFAPDSTEQREVIGMLVVNSPALRDLLKLEAIATPSMPAGAEHLAGLMDVLQSTVIELDYIDGEGKNLQRRVSPQRIYHAPPRQYLIAWSHRSNALRWFRIDRIRGFHAQAGEAFVAVDDALIDEDMTSRIDGYRDPDPPRVFQLRFPTEESCQWVLDAIPGMSTVHPTGGEVVVRVVTSAPLQLARHLVALDAQFRIESAELRGMVLRLAELAVARHQNTEQ